MRKYDPHRILFPTRVDYLGARWADIGRAGARAGAQRVAGDNAMAGRAIGLPDRFKRIFLSAG